MQPNILNSTEKEDTSKIENKDEIFEKAVQLLQ